MHDTRKPPLKIGLVFGAGGPVGHAWHAGVLRALAEASRWDPRSAEVMLGTSAGAQIAALLRAGMSPHDLAARVTGEPLSPHGAALSQHFVRPEHAPSPTPRNAPPPRLRPAAPGYLLHAVRRPWTVRPGRLAAALLPPGRVSMAPQIDGLRRIFGLDWPTQDLWVTAVQMKTGRAVAFGREDAPVTTDVGTAVSSSSAVPGMREPVRIGQHHYVDGGMASPTHLELLAGRSLDLVIVSSPLSIYGPMRMLLRRELRRLERSGTRVVALEPSPAASWAMGWNCMDLARSAYVARAAWLSTRQELAHSPEGRELLDTLAVAAAAPTAHDDVGGHTVPDRRAG